MIMLYDLCCAWLTGRSSLELRMEADSGDVSQPQHNGKSKPHKCQCVTSDLQQNVTCRSIFKRTLNRNHTRALIVRSVIVIARA